MNRVRSRREELGILAKEFADQIGRSGAFVSMMEGGFVPSSPARRVQIAEALQTTPEALWPEEYS